MLEGKEYENHKIVSKIKHKKEWTVNVKLTLFILIYVYIWIMKNKFTKRILLHEK